ncbi:MAG: 3D domain-containing protein [Patescibacteria group bacterium]|nr:3D domain-containing protein [Patescibacteria group bacterium]MCL5262096.1 3D domain-containing protein [Patescibacteria group bacterium]
MGKSILLGTMLMSLVASAPGRPSDAVANTAPNIPDHPYVVLGGDSLLASNEPASTRSIVTTITGYSSTEDQTDDTPFITASGKFVGDGIVAANWLPFGTKIRIPEIFGDKVFEVQDRMAPKHNGKMDIWFKTREEALKFGVKQSRIEIL